MFHVTKTEAKLFLKGVMHLGDKIKQTLDFKANLEKIKAYVKELSAERRKKYIKIGLIVLAVCLAAVIVLYLNGSTYVALYSNLSSSETESVYQALNELGINARIDENNNVLVPKKEYNNSLLQLAAQGYPSSALAYDIFSEHTGLTSTETEQKQVLIYQLQDRLQSTLTSMADVRSAIVNISIPTNQNYAWQTAADTQVSTASVTLTMRSGVTLSGQQVSAIKNLVAASVPKLDPSHVIVVDSVTRTELFGSDDAGYSSSQDSYFTHVQNLEFESMIRSQIENNIERLLEPRYGIDGVVAVAMVTLDYETMIGEEMRILTDDDGNGYPSHISESYDVNGQESLGGIVGEEDNTDIPNYAYREPTEDGGITDWDREIDYYYGYIKRQIEKGDAELERATVSVLVAEPDMTPAMEQELISLISNAVDIAPEMISVASFYRATGDAFNVIEFIEALPLWAIIAAGVLLLLLIITILLIALSGKKRRKKARAKKGKKGAVTATAPGAPEPIALPVVNEEKTEEQQMMDTVREFAKQNPDITASLLRVWMREE